MIGLAASVRHRVRRLVGGLAGSVDGDRWVVGRLRALVGGWHFDRLGDLDHDGRVHHLRRWAVAYLRSIAGVREVRRDRVLAGNGNIGDDTSPVVGTLLARTLIVTVCTGRLGIAGRRPRADDFIVRGRQSHRRGGV